MKTYNILVLFILSLTFFACENDTVQPSAMKYSPDKTIVTDTVRCLAGENITFTPSGNSDYVSFWSGETASNYYDAKSTTVLNAKISFVSGLFKAFAKSNKYSFSVLLSTDYTACHVSNGTAIISIQNATWKDISSNFADNTTASSSTGVPSGSLDVTQYANTPFYIAFKYKNDTLAKGPKAIINSFQVADSTKEFGLKTNLINPVTSLVTGPGTASWFSCLVSGANQWGKSTDKTYLQVSEPITQNESWLISPIINLSRGTANQGVYVKDITGLPRPYSYTYKTAGVYTAVFVYTNSNLGVSKQTIQKFIIEVK